MEKISVKIHLNLGIQVKSTSLAGIYKSGVRVSLNRCIYIYICVCVCVWLVILEFQKTCS